MRDCREGGRENHGSHSTFFLDCVVAVGFPDEDGKEEMERVGIPLWEIGGRRIR